MIASRPKNLKAYHLFWATSCLIFLIGLCYLTIDSTLVINIHDTYFVISHWHIGILLTVGYFFLGLGYWFVERIGGRTVKWLTFLHTFILIGCFVWNWLWMGYNAIFPQPWPPLFEGLQNVNAAITAMVFLIFLVAQPVYVANLTIALFRRKKK